MLSLSNVLTPLAGEIGLGGVGGFIVGYAVKKVAKVLALVAGLGFFALQYLAYKNVITIDYTSLRDWMLNLVGQMTELQPLVTDVIVHIPFGASFAGGFYLGLKKG